MSRVSLALRLAAPAVLFATTLGCDYSGDFLFAGEVENMPGVIHIFAEDGSELLTPIDAQDAAELRAGAIFGELAPNRGAAFGGATFNFEGTGGPVCVFVDPETVFWNWSVAPVPNVQQKLWNHPDNVFDDGDIDLFVGLSAYYTGSPGVSLGDFFVDYTDSLGNEVPIELSECTNLGLNGQVNAHAGRGFPEMCSLPFTDPGVSYTGMLQTFSTPLDDDRLGFGLIVFNGTCEQMIFRATGIGAQQQGDAVHGQECVLTGESVVPRKIGPNDLTYCTGEGCLDAWPGSVAFESEFCLGAQSDMRAFCRKEERDMFDAGIECGRETIDTVDNRCYCGDSSDLPTPGAI